jgi:hypothetical protein
LEKKMIIKFQNKYNVKIQCSNDLEFVDCGNYNSEEDALIMYNYSFKVLNGTEPTKLPEYFEYGLVHKNNIEEQYGFLRVKLWI